MSTFSQVKAKVGLCFKIQSLPKAGNTEGFISSKAKTPASTASSKTSLNQFPMMSKVKMALDPTPFGQPIVYALDFGQGS